MRQAWEATLRRHEIFSLAMSRDDGNDHFFTGHDGPGLVWIDREADGVGSPARKARSGFGDESLEDGLQQVTLVRRPGDRWELHGLSHHAWMDGRSRRIDGPDHNGLVKSPYLDRWMSPFSAEIERSLAGA